MRYDFDRIIDRRGTSCVKWDQNQAVFGTEDVLDMWVADMDFPCPEPVLEALRRRLDHPILGYTVPPESLYQAIIDRMARRFGWTVEKDWIVFAPGVVTAVYAAVRALAQPGDDILVQPPVYFPFFGAVIDSGCQMVHNPLREEEAAAGSAGAGASAPTGAQGIPAAGPRYAMDFDDLERRFGPPGVGGRPHRIRGLIFCSPHNPVGRVWTPEELRRLADICLRNNCVIVSDEIHCDLMVGGARHTPLASLSPEIAARTITLMAPSKSFNLAGMEASFAIISDPGLRKAFEKARRGQSGVNLLGYVAMEAALREGDEYLEQLDAYVTDNFSVFGEAIAAIPGLRLTPAEGTYLAWVDMRGLGLDDAALNEFIVKKARLGTNAGAMFGAGGEGFHRFDLACPRSYVEEAARRLAAAVKELGR